MSGTIEDFVAAINWPDDTLAAQFATECDLFWGTEEGRKQILSWKPLIGKPSQFLERQLWVVADLIEHNRLHDEWTQANQDNIDEQEQQDATSPQGEKDQIREAARIWHEAVQLRRVNLALSRDWLDIEVDKLRKQHLELDTQWTDYVAKTRKELKRLRGY